MDQPLATIPAATTASATEYRLHPKLAGLWARICAIVVALPALAGSTVLAILELWWLVPVPIVPLLMLPWLTAVYGRAYVARFRCQLQPAGILIHRGVWWRAQIFVPRGRVQHTDVDQGPLARRHGMATLKIFTAGSVHSLIEVEGLRLADALHLRDDMLERHGRQQD